MEEVRSNEYVNESNNIILKVFFRMFLGLLATGLTAFFMYKSGMYNTIMASNSTLAVIALIEIGVVLLFSFLFKKLSPLAVTILFYLYAFINGLTLSAIFAMFEMDTIFYAFFTTAALFGGLAFYGYVTKRDMSKFGSIFLVTLIVGAIVSIVNLFLGNKLIDIALDWVMLFVFCGLTVYDMNKIKNMGQEIEYDSEKLYIYGAMELYLDFINIFIRILSILSRLKRD